MRIKDYRRFITRTQQLVREAERLNVINLTESLYEVDFQNKDPVLLASRLKFHYGLLKTVAIYALKSDQLELAKKATTLIQGLNRGGVKHT